MKRTPNASLAFKTKKPADKPGFGENVINSLLADALKDEPLFPDLPVTVKDLQTLNNALFNAIAAKVIGGRAASVAVKQAVTEWNIAFTLTANYVNSVALGNEAIILAGGFIPTKSESTATVIPGPIVDFQASINGKQGAIIANGKYAASDAEGYVCIAAPPSVTINYGEKAIMIEVGDIKIYMSATTKRKVEMYNLPKASTYNVTMYAFNSKGNGPAAAAQEVIPQ